MADCEVVESLTRNVCLGEGGYEISRDADLARCRVEADVDLDCIPGRHAGRRAILGAEWHPEATIHPRDGCPVGVVADRDP